MKTLTYIAFGMMFMLADAMACMVAGFQFDAEKSIKAAIIWPIATPMLISSIHDLTQGMPPASVADLRRCAERKATL